MIQKPAIAIHGGAGTILRSTMTPEREKEYRTALEQALKAGYQILQNGGSSLDAVEAAVVSLENCPLFNAGRGAVFTHDATHEMDASIMEGAQLNAGAVAGIFGPKNPIMVARAVMEKSEHVLLAAEGANKFAKEQGFEFMDSAYFHTDQRYNQLQEALEEDRIQLDHSEGKKFGTVGAVAIDQAGNLAAATSTGGMTNKRWGRVGDSPIIGAGTYADNHTCAVSCTGHGEYFIRSVVAFRISCLMSIGQKSLKEAAEEVVNNHLVKTGGEGGLVAIDRKGNISMPFNSAGMYRGSIDQEGNITIAIYDEA
jgi:beta-aspartyl-peptidase (threonine type)